MYQRVGLKRTLSVALFLFGQAATVIPVLVPIVPFLNMAAAAFGIVGIGGAVIKGTLAPKVLK